MTNVDPNEIHNFEQLSQNWWDKDNGPMRLLHQLNPLRLQFIKDNCQLKTATALDVGCGGGIFSEALAESGADVTAIDMGEQLIAVAKQHAADNNLKIDYQTADLHQWSKSNGPFDLISCLEMLEHVPDPAAIINDLSSLLKPGATLYLSTINRTPLAFITTIVGVEYVLRWLPHGTHRYDKFIKPAELAKMCRAANLEVEKIQGVKYNPLNGKFSLTNNCSINYLLIAKKPDSKQ